MLEIPLKCSLNPINKNPSVALALSGGGARGLAQIGVLKVLEEYQIPVRGIAGSSIGAVIGGLYAAGYTAEELDSLARTIQWDELMQNSPPRKQLFLSQKSDRAKYLMQLRFNHWKLDLPSAYSSGQKFSNIITGMILNARHPFPEDFDSLPVKFRSVSTDLVSGRKIVIKDGFLVEAIRASMAIPLLFSPVEKDSALLVDGGLVQNLPVDEAKSLKSDLVIAVDTSSKLREQKDLTAPWEIADQVTSIMQQERTQSQLELADIQIQPQLDGISNTDFSDIPSLIHAGEQATRNAIPQIQMYTSTEEDSFYIKEILLHGIEEETNLIRDELKEDAFIQQSQLEQTFSKYCHLKKRSITRTLLDTSNAILHVYFIENPQIEKITITGNSVFHDSLLVKPFKTQLPFLFHSQAREALQEFIIRKYRENGYSLCKIDSVFCRDNSLILVLDEGILNKVQVSGRIRTKKFVASREMGSKPGELFRADRVQKDVDNIYSTGYFEAVGFQVIPEGEKNLLKINVIEQGTMLLRSGIRFDNERYVKGFMQIMEDNFYGLGTQVYLSGLTGRKDNLVEACVRSDRFFNTMFTYKACASYTRNRHHFYENYRDAGQYLDLRTTFSYTIGQQMQRLGTISFKIASEHIHLKPYHKEPGPFGHESWLLRNITIQSEVDTRDKLPFPNEGKYHLLSYETGGHILGGDKSYSKIYSSIESYSPLARSLNFHTKIVWGNADHDTPFPKQFSLGGLNAFGGLKENMMIGKRFLLISGELRFKLNWIKWMDIYLTGRYEFGGLWNNYEKIKNDDFLQAATFSCAFETPLGPFIFAWGQTSTRQDQFYFSAGYYF